MRKSLLFLVLSCLLAVSCGSDDNYLGYYITYDEVEVRESPSEDAPVVLKLICINRPSSYKQAEGDVPCAFAADSGGPSPIGVKKIDASGKWGYIDESIPMILHWKGWIPLDQMIYCGTQAADEIVPTYEVREDHLAMYRHPEENKKEQVRAYNIKAGDKVLLRASQGRWSFVSWFYCSDSGDKKEMFGWVPTKSIAQVDAVTRGELEEEVYGKMLDKTKDKRLSINTITVLRKVFLVGCILGLLFTLVFLVPGIRRKLWLPTLLWMPGLTLLLFFGSYLTSAPAFTFALLMIPLAYVVTHPLRFRRNASGYFYPFWIISVGGCVIMLVFLKFLSGGPLILNIITSALNVFVVVMLSSLITSRIAHNICPHCGFYANHPTIRVEDKGESVSEGVETSYSYDGSSSRTNWLGERVVTNYYKAHHRTVYYINHHYVVVRQCVKCGKEIREPKVKSREATPDEVAQIKAGIYQCKKPGDS